MQDSGGQAGCSGSRGKAPISLSQEWVWSQPADLTLNLTPPPQLPFQIQIHAKMEEMCTDAKKILQILHKILHKTKSPSFP